MLRRESRWMIPENRLLRRKFGPEESQRRSTGEDCIMKNFVT
jgi:hypothetical protein